MEKYTTDERMRLDYELVCDYYLIAGDEAHFCIKKKRYYTKLIGFGDAKPKNISYTLE